mmetsp:Transcript_46015/g.90657  ORF Transcript_46015/g.90657 Transcript_46015/m.90657 type:complete len:95 (-) Transcript_46015:504-788(-)
MCLEASCRLFVSFFAPTHVQTEEKQANTPCLLVLLSLLGSKRRRGLVSSFYFSFSGQREEQAGGKKKRMTERQTDYTASFLSVQTGRRTEGQMD